MTKEELETKKEELTAEIERLSEYVECSDCHGMSHPDDISHMTHWECLCKNCDMGEN
jgi:hypothetical protein